MDDFGKAEDIAILALVIVIGYGLYKAGGAFSQQIDQLFGLNPDAANTAAGGGGTYTGAVNQVITHLWGSLESILGIGPAYPSSSDVLVGSTPVGGVSGSW